MKRIARFRALSFYCITLALICQYFCGLAPVFATGNDTETTTSRGTQNFYFDDYQADYYLSQDADGRGNLRVVEEFTAIFPSSNQNHGITRVIPYTNLDGKHLTMASDQELEIKLYRNDQLEQPYRIENGDGYFRVYIGSPSAYVQGEQVYRLEYEFRDVITSFTENGKRWQELYWDTNGNDWSQRFNRVNATLHFESAETAAAFTGQAWCYVGSYGIGDQSRCEVEKIDERTLKFSAQELSSRENLTFNVEFQPDTFAQPIMRQNYATLVILGCELVVIAGVAAYYLYLAKRTAAKREYYQGLFVKPEYAPPKGFTVGEMSENYYKTVAGNTEKVATLMELAVQGKVELVKSVRKTIFGRTATEWRINVKSLELRPEEILVLQILVGHKRELNVGQEIVIKSHSANNALVKMSREYAKVIQKRNAENGLGIDKLNKAGSGSGSSKRTIGASASLGEAVVMILLVLAIAATAAVLICCGDAPSYLAPFGGPALVALDSVLPWATFIVGAVISTKLSLFLTHTEKGLEYSRYMEGLKLYIEMAEKERIEFLQSVKGVDVSHQGIVKLYEKLLPYALIFGLEKSWTNELGRYYEMEDVASPTWYAGVGAFSARDFNTAIVAASSTISSSISHSTTSSSSSGSSGSGGGGFSGGGGGGGGGGGW